MIEVRNQEHLDAVRAFAAALPDPRSRESLERCLERLEDMASDGGKCVLFKDFAPHSFEFSLLHGDGTPWMSGGVLSYVGPESGSSSPQFSVSNSGLKYSRWEVHT
jgi:hypothetical protein